MTIKLAQDMSSRLQSMLGDFLNRVSTGELTKSPFLMSVVPGLSALKQQMDSAVSPEAKNAAGQSVAQYIRSAYGRMSKDTTLSEDVRTSMYDLYRASASFMPQPITELKEQPMPSSSTPSHEKAPEHKQPYKPQTLNMVKNIQYLLGVPQSGRWDKATNDAFMFWYDSQPMLKSQRFDEKNKFKYDLRVALRDLESLTGSDFQQRQQGRGEQIAELPSLSRSKGVYDESEE